MLSGIEAGLRAQGAAPEGVTVVGFAGDGGTADIGLEALSGAIDRNDDVLYIRHDNEAYMNTGIQKSSLTPFGASTTTTPAGKREHGCLTQKKSLFDIVAAHRIPYAATASVGYLNDFIKKVERARDIKGTRFIHVMAPCPVGWGFPSADMVDVAREIVDAGLWYLAEYEGPALTGTPGGTFRLNRDPKEFKPIEPYLRRQGRFLRRRRSRSGPHRARPRRALVLHARRRGDRTSGEQVGEPGARSCCRVNLPGDNRAVPLFGCVSVPQGFLRFFLEYGECMWGC